MGTTSGDIGKTVQTKNTTLRSAYQLQRANVRRGEENSLAPHPQRYLYDNNCSNISTGPELSLHILT